MEKTRVHVFIQGKVQGVFYRSWARSTAESLELSGWVKNLEDGRVEAIFEGEKDKVEKMVELCEAGSRAAEVTHVDVIREDALGDIVGFKVIS